MNSANIQKSDKCATYMMFLDVFKCKSSSLSLLPTKLHPNIQYIELYGLYVYFEGNYYPQPWFWVTCLACQVRYLCMCPVVCVIYRLYNHTIDVPPQT